MSDNNYILKCMSIFEKDNELFFQKHQEFSGEFFDIPDNNVILNSIRVYEDHSSFSKPVEYVIISNNDSTKIRIIQIIGRMIYMDITNEFIKIPRMEISTEQYYDLNKDDIILNSIQVHKVHESWLGERIPFDIKMIDGKMRIVPLVIADKYMITYDYFVEAKKITVKGKKITVKAEDIPKYKFDDNNYTFYFDCKRHLLK